MKIEIEISEDNAAFSDNPNELRRILRAFADRFADYRSGNRSRLMDYNGNAVGVVTVTE